MKLRVVGLALLFLCATWWRVSEAIAEDPPAPVEVEEPAEPILPENEAAVAEADADADAGTDDNQTTTDESAPAAGTATASGENAGQDDLDAAAQLKVTAETLPDLNDVVDKLDSAIEKGLDQDNQAFADQLLISALLQRATVLSSAVLDRAQADPRRDPRLMQLRQFAVNDLQRVVSLDDSIAEAHLLLGRLQALLGDASTSRRELTKVINAKDATPDDQAQAYALRGTLQRDEATRASDFDAAIKLVPEKPDYYRIRAQYRYSQDKFDDAYADVTKALEMEPDHPGTIELRGLILLGLKKNDEALAAFTKASELAPEAVPLRQRLGEVYRQQGDLKKAVEQLTKALEIAPNDAATLLLRANVYNQLDDTAAALKDVDEAIKLQPQLLVAHLLKAEILASESRIDEAITNLEKLVPLAPNQPRLLEPLATFYLVGGYPRKSIETYTKILEQEPENYRALRFRGDANLNIGNHEAAAADFDKALQLSGEDEGLLNNFAWVLATSPDDKVRDGKRSIELATKAAKLSSYNVPHILSTLGAAYAETGDFENAKKWSQKAIEVTKHEMEGAKDDEERARLEESNQALEKELASYEQGEPVRERQEQQDKEPTSPGTEDKSVRVEPVDADAASPKNEEQAEVKSAPTEP